MATKPLFRILVLSILLFCLGAPGIVQAQESTPFQPSEQELIFSGKVGDTIQRTFELVLQGDPASGVELSPGDLKDQDGVVGVLASDIGIDPQIIDVLDATRRVVVTVSGTQKAGVYEGELTIRMSGEAVGVVKLTADIRAVPLVDTTENSKNVILSVVASGFPFGPSTVDSQAKATTSTVISLLQNEASPARITGANMLSLRRADGNTLPDGAVIVSDAMPVEVEGHGGTNLTLAARGANLRAGEYSGLLLVQVREQPTAVEVPVTVRVKDGFWLAFLILLVGPVVGLILKFRSGQGQVLIDAVARVEKLREAIRPNAKGDVYLCANQRIAIDELIQEAMRVIQENKPAEVIESALAAAESKFVEHSETTKAWAKGPLAATEAEAAVKAATDPLYQPWVNRLKQISDDLKSGQMPTIEAAQAKLDKIVAEIADYESKEDKTFVEGSSGTMGLRGDEDEGVFSSWGLYRLRLNLMRISAFAIVYAFTLAVGWATIYVAKPTFGEDVQDYLTLLLWSATSTTIGGQMFDLKSIYSQTQNDVQNPAG